MEDLPTGPEDGPRSDMNKASKLYSSLTKLNAAIIEANEQMKKQFVSWNTSVLSGEIFLKREEIDSELDKIKSNLTIKPKSALQGNTKKNLGILEKYMVNLRSSNPVDVPATKTPGLIVSPPVLVNPASPLSPTAQPTQSPIRGVTTPIPKAHEIRSK